MMDKDLKGYYLDGQIAIRQFAVIQVMAKGLKIKSERGGRLWWPNDKVRLQQHLFGSEQVRLEKDGENPEMLLVPRDPFFRALRQLGSGMAKKLPDRRRHKMGVALPIFASLAVVGITTILYLWGIPGAASLLASKVPISWEEHLGQATVEKMAPPEKRCPDPNLNQFMDEMIATLTAPLSRNPYIFRVIVVDNPRVNAFAAPGGYIIIFRGLLQRTQTPEELAGVLGHELQHILHRHPTRALLQQASIGILLVALTGDVKGAMSFGLEGARILGTLRYSRELEEMADHEGMNMLLASGVDPMGMITFFQKMSQDGEKSPEILTYLSSHPNPESRIAHLKLLARRSRRSSVPLLQGYNWEEVRRACEKKGPKR
jgi:predicted Zn-dependent protease